MNPSFKIKKKSRLWVQPQLFFLAGSLFQRKTMFKIAGLILSIALWNGCSVQQAMDRCQILVKDIQLKKVGILSTDINVTLSVNNPNRFGATIHFLGYEIYVEENKIATGEKEDQIQIKEKGLTEIQFPVTINNIQFGSSYIKLKNEGELDCTVKGKIKVKTRFGMATLPYKVSKKIKDT